MSSRVATPLRTRRFHTSIGGVVSAVLLYLAMQSLVAAAQEPLLSWIPSAINILIERGRFDVLRLPEMNILWRYAAIKLLAGIVYLVICLAIAAWVHRRRVPR